MCINRTHLSVPTVLLDASKSFEPHSIRKFDAESKQLCVYTREPRGPELSAFV